MDKQAVLTSVKTWAKARVASAKAAAESRAAERLKKVVEEVKANPDKPFDSPLKEAIRTEMNKARTQYEGAVREHSRSAAKKGLAAGVGLGAIGTGTGVATYSHLKKKKK